MARAERREGRGGGRAEPGRRGDEGASGAGSARPAVRIDRSARPQAPLRVLFLTGATAAVARTAGPQAARRRGQDWRRVWREISGWLWGFAIVALGVVALPLAGLVGFHHGFARAVGLPELIHEPGAGVVEGVRMLLDAPQRVFDAGLIDTGALTVAMALAIAGAAALTLALAAAAFSGRYESGLDEEETEYEAEGDVELAIGPLAAATYALGAVAAIVVSVLQIGWLFARGQGFLSLGMPWEPAAFETWLERGRVAAGLDVLALLAALIWLVFAFRLRTALWLKTLAVVSAVAAVLILLGAAAMSQGVVAQVDRPRAVVASRATDVESAGGVMGDAATSERRLLLGRAATHVVLVTRDGTMRLVPAGAPFDVVARESLAEFVTGAERE